MDRLMAGMDTSTPRLSVIVPCRGHARELRRCLDSLSVQECPESFEIIVVDSAADAEVAEVVAAFPSVRLLRSREGLLPGPARNLGARHARGTLLLFVDADCSCEPGWLAAGVAALQDEVRMVGGPVLDGQPWHPLAAADNFLQFADLSARRQRGPIRLIPSCNMGIRSRDFAELGGFAAMPAGEDVLLSTAASERWPRSLVFEPRMRVRHFGRTTWRGLWQHQEQFGRARGALGLELRPWQQRVGRLAAAAPAIWAKRLVFLSGRAAKNGPTAVARMLVLLPVLALGLVAWCRGFRQGCQQAVNEQSRLSGP
jgi:glycosyltransferase involved in cell wall biosynthesis